MAGKGPLFQTGVVVLALIFAAWVVLLAGVSGQQHDCVTVPSVTNCKTTFRFQWWAIWFEFFVWAFALCVWFTSTKATTAVIGLLSVVTAILMFATNSAQNQLDAPDLVSAIISGGSDSTTKLRATFAGYLMLSALNSILIIIMGTECQEGDCCKPSATPAPKDPSGVNLQAEATTLAPPPETANTADNAV